MGDEAISPSKFLNKINWPGHFLIIIFIYYFEFKNGDIICYIITKI